MSFSPLAKTHAASASEAVAAPTTNGTGISPPPLSPDIAMLLAQSVQFVSDAVKLIRYHDGQFTFHYLNQAALREFQELGFHSETFLHKSPNDCLPTVQAQELIQAYSKVVEAKREQTFEIAMPLPDGSLRYFQRQIIPLLNENGEIPFIVSIMHDISSQNSIGKHQHRLALMLENAPGLLMLANNASIYFFNPAALSRLEINDTQNLDFAPSDFFDDPSILSNVILPSVRANDTWRGECILRTLSGKTFPASVIVVGQRKEDENIEEYFFICIDRTEQKAIEQRLFESERLARLIIDNVQLYAFIRLDTNGTITSWNQGAERLFEYDADAVIGRNVGILEPKNIDSNNDAPANEGFTEGILSQALNTEEFSYESLRVSSAGRLFYAENTLTALYDHAGRHLGYSLIVHDVSGMRRMKDELRRKRRETDIFVEHASDIITRYNIQKICVFANRAAESVFNNSRSSILGMSIEEILQTSPEMERVHLLINRVIDTGSEAHTRGSFETSQGKLTFAIKAIPEFDTQNRLETIIVIASDITTEITAQELLLKTLGEAKDLEEFKLRFQKVISHELRTPLAGVKMSADIVERYMSSLSQEELLYHTKEINASVREIEILLDNMLLTMKVETQTLKTNFTSCDIIELCQQEIETFRRAHRITRAIEFSSSTKQLPLLLDKYLVHIILRNILTNAINYSDESSVVRIWVGMLRDRVCITVHDSGIGIAPETLPNIFQPFFRGKNAENIPGIGMGLFVAQHCVELHQGIIDLQSTFGEETMVTVMLPVLSAK